MIHECSTCQAKKIVIMKIENDDSKVYELIINGINTSKIAYNQNVLPKKLSKNDVKKYYEKIFNNNIHYENLRNEWWKHIAKKYNIKLNNYIKIDTINNELYQCINQNGNKIINYISKK